MSRLVDEALRQGTTTLEIKSGYGLTVEDEARSLRIAAQFTPETTYLGAHVVPDGTDPDTYHAAERAGRVTQDIPTNHNPAFAPVIHPTLETGIEAMVTAALDALAG